MSKRIKPSHYLVYIYNYPDVEGHRSLHAIVKYKIRFDGEGGAYAWKWCEENGIVDQHYHDYGASDVAEYYELDEVDATPKLDEMEKK